MVTEGGDLFSGPDRRSKTSYCVCNLQPSILLIALRLHFQRLFFLHIFSSTTMLPCSLFFGNINICQRSQFP